MANIKNLSYFDKLYTQSYPQLLWKRIDK